MGLFWAIAVVMLLSWAVGFAALPQYSPWIHVPLLVALFAFAIVLTRRRPRAKPHA